MTPEPRRVEYVSLRKLRADPRNPKSHHAESFSRQNRMAAAAAAKSTSRAREHLFTYRAQLRLHSPNR